MMIDIGDLLHFSEIWRENQRSIEIFLPSIA